MKESARRGALLGVALAAGLLALAWSWFDGSLRRSGEVPTAVGVAQAPLASGAERDELEPAAAPAPKTPAAPAARETRISPREEELARGIAVEGRVVFPPGTPADERVFVEARGRTFASGGYD
ncbi:MAG: hypothetical protein ABL998_08715, partial [Planctomycetota bacterium]